MKKMHVIHSGIAAVVFALFAMSAAPAFAQVEDPAIQAIVAATNAVRSRYTESPLFALSGWPRSPEANAQLPASDILAEVGRRVGLAVLAPVDAYECPDTFPSICRPRNETTLLMIGRPRIAARSATLDITVARPMPNGRAVQEVLRVSLDREGDRSWRVLKVETIGIT